jgi:hypothetical protein
VFLTSILRFLGVDDTVDRAHFPLTSRFREGRAIPPPPRIRELLWNVYERRIDDLEKYLGWNFSTWRTAYTACERKAEPVS